jgi:hypothetical protein
MWQFARATHSQLKLANCLRSHASILLTSHPTKMVLGDFKRRMTLLFLESNVLLEDEDGDVVKSSCTALVIRNARECPEVLVDGKSHQLWNAKSKREMTGSRMAVEGVQVVVKLLIERLDAEFQSDDVHMCLAPFDMRQYLRFMQGHERGEWEAWASFRIQKLARALGLNAKDAKEEFFQADAWLQLARDFCFSQQWLQVLGSVQAVTSWFYFMFQC